MRMIKKPTAHRETYPVLSGEREQKKIFQMTLPPSCGMQKSIIKVKKTIEKVRIYSVRVYSGDKSP
jgi:hypothetical protein